MDVTAFLRRPREAGVKTKRCKSREGNKNADFKSFSIVFLNCLYEILVFSCASVIFRNGFQSAVDNNKTCMKLHCKVWVTGHVQENAISMEEEIWEQRSRIFEPTHALFSAF